jgi:hypothetical protein
VLAPMLAEGLSPLVPIVVRYVQQQRQPARGGSGPDPVLSVQ